MKINVVIGANYGDEGKGLVTNWRCWNAENPIVVMTNGGCQRGHTVQDLRTNRRHVFHHFGSGTFMNVPTYFPATYFMNPMKYVEEYRQLKNLNINDIKCYASDRCLMQFPADIFVNQALEYMRKQQNEEHGSVGWGIWETVLRNVYCPMLLADFAKLPRNQQYRVCK